MHCFVCTKCGKRINRKAFSDSEQNPYCTLCKPSSFYAIEGTESPAPKSKEAKPPAKAPATKQSSTPKIICEICKKAVLAKPLSMQGKIYHSGCLRCNQCKQGLRGEACLVGGQIYCSDCGPKKLKSEK